EQDLAGDESGGVRAQEPYRPRDVLRPAEAAERSVGQHELLHVVGDHLRQPRIDVARRYDVCAYAPIAELACECLREADDARLGGRVIRLARIPVQADDARDVDDRADAALHHSAHRGSARMERAVKIRLDHDPPVFVRHTREQPIARDARVVDEYVELAGSIDQRPRLLRIRDVGLDGASARLLRPLLRPLLARAAAYGALRPRTHARA